MVIATGTPEQVARVDRSYTGGFLTGVLPVRASRAGTRRRAAVAAG
jgi:hypothetical protein